MYGARLGCSWIARSKSPTDAETRPLRNLAIPLGKPRAIWTRKGRQKRERETGRERQKQPVRWTVCFSCKVAMFPIHSTHGNENQTDKRQEQQPTHRARHFESQPTTQTAAKCKQENLVRIAADRAASCDSSCTITQQ